MTRSSWSESCFICGRPLKDATARIVACADDQFPWVGPDCYTLVLDAGRAGYQSPRGGPRVWTPEIRAKMKKVSP